MTTTKASCADTKIVAMYLPQFHEVMENDEWWGKGFTEWTAVTRATPLFKDHKQPKVPLNNNYYDLLNYETLAWQAALMKKYNVDGICIYHYWFKNGRKILEKPSENILLWSKLDINYCFSWANETWSRTWSNLQDGNAWSSKYEKLKDRQDNGILLEQRYGDIEDWRKHFYYLLPFFCDERYIKIDGKPVFMFYKTKNISCLENMIECWNDLAVQHGFPGIYTIGNEPRGAQKECIDEIFLAEPANAMRNCVPSKKNGVNCYNYDEVWKNILGIKDEKLVNIGAFVNYDDTARHGKKGSVIEGFTVEKFKKYLTDLLVINKKNGRKITFINAWNEWGEGMYLEPDSEFHYGCLEAIREARQKEEKIEDINNFGKEYFLKTISNNDADDKNNSLIHILDNWLKIKESGICLKQKMEKYKGKKVAIYGYGILGKHLLEELKGTEFAPAYVIDQRDLYIGNIETYRPDDKWPKVDIVIVTAFYEYGYIYKLIREKTVNTEIISLEHMICEL